MFKAKRRTVVTTAAAVFVLLVAALVVTVVTQGNGEASDNMVAYPVGQRPAAPEFTATSLTGTPINFASYRGKVVVLNVWGSWCPPCRGEGQTLKYLDEQYGPEGVAFLGDDIEDTPTNALAFLRRRGHHLSERERLERGGRAATLPGGADLRHAHDPGHRQDRAHRGDDRRGGHVPGGHHPAARRGGDPVTDVHASPPTSKAAPKSESADLEREATRAFGTGPAELAESGSGGTSGPSGTGAGWGRWAWRQLTSMRTALILLFLLALGSVPGSILPQEGADPASVTQYFQSHPALAPWLNRLGLFNVFASPWFAAIYLLLFASLIGCVVPRTFKLVGSARTPPPRAPRNLARLPHSVTYPSALAPGAAVDAAASVLGGQRFRLRRPAAGDSGQWVAAEKGYLREVGNLLFHLSLLGVLLSIALGGLFGYKADELVVQGQTGSATPPRSWPSSTRDGWSPGLTWRRSRSRSTTSRPATSTRVSPSGSRRRSTPT